MTDRLSTIGEDGVIRGATFSPCRIYRYVLERMWDADKPKVTWILLNPSTADHERDDPTNKRGISFSRRWGFGTCVFVNLFAFRASKPATMKQAQDPVGPENDRHVLQHVRDADRIVVAWGSHGAWRDRGREAVDAIQALGLEMHCFGLCKNGHPKHPLYLPNASRLRRVEFKLLAR